MAVLQDQYKMRKKIIKLLNQEFKKPITCLTAYSPSIAKILDGIVDIILIGDSLGNTLYGMKNSRGVTLNMMKAHGLAVTKNVKKSFTVLDMPYKSYMTKRAAYKNAKDLLKFTKANMLKLEINKNNLSIVKYLSERKLNIIAHIGVTPQSFINFNKIKVVGKTQNEIENLLYLAVNAEKAGAKAILLECIIKDTAKKITSSISIPTIGIGSSNFCDGQVLVFDDMINLDNKQKLPKFVKKYMNFEQLAKKAVKNFSKDVKSKKFPNKKYTYN